MTDEQMTELRDFIGSCTEALEAKIDKIIDMLDERLPKTPVVPGVPEGTPVEPPKGTRIAPFSYIDSGCVLNGSNFKYCFPIRVGSGGEARGIKLQDNQRIHVSSGGKAVFCTITDFARITADVGASLIDIVIRDGGIATATKGWTYLDSLKVRDSGTVLVASGGSLGIAEVSSGGKVVLDKGAWVEQIDVFSSGMVCINDSDVGMSALTIYHGGIVRFATSDTRKAFEERQCLTISSGGIVDYIVEPEAENGEE